MAWAKIQEEIWTELVNIRNKTFHTYSLKIAEEIYAKLPDALSAFKKLLNALNEKT